MSERFKIWHAQCHMISLQWLGKGFKLDGSTTFYKKKWWLSITWRICLLILLSSNSPTLVIESTMNAFADKRPLTICLIGKVILQKASHCGPICLVQVVMEVSVEGYFWVVLFPFQLGFIFASVARLLSLCHDRELILRTQHGPLSSTISLSGLCEPCVETWTLTEPFNLTDTQA